VTAPNAGSVLGARRAGGRAGRRYERRPSPLLGWPFGARVPCAWSHGALRAGDARVGFRRQASPRFGM